MGLFSFNLMCKVHHKNKAHFTFELIAIYVHLISLFLKNFFSFAIAFEILCMNPNTPPEAIELSSLLWLGFVLLNCDLCCNRKESFLRPATVLL